MTDPSRPPEAGPPGAPRWVKVSAIVAAVVIAGIVVVALMGGGGHGPSRHLPGNNQGNHTPPAEHGP